MQSINTSFQTTTEVKRSKFISHLVPIDEFKKMKKELKEQHPKASHIVYALRYFNEFDQIVENASDDGEPKGCAGVPALTVLRGQEIINCAVLIVRYFGGIKLGTGGMVRAYSLSVKNVLDLAILSLYEKQIPYTFSSSYKEIDKILYKLKSLDIKDFERDFGVENVIWKLKGSQKSIESFNELNS